MANVKRFLAGTYGTGEKQGIASFDVDLDAGKLLELKMVDPAEHASYLTRYGDFVYALSETGHGGALHAFRLVDGELKLLNRLEGLESILAHLSVSPDGKHLLRISYGTGHIGACSLSEDGSLGQRESELLHEGCGPFPGRQTKAHCHSILPTPDGKHATVCDLGTDEVLVVDLAPDGTLSWNPEMSLRLPGGTGPRQQVWSADGRRLYVVTEMGYQVAVLDWDPRRGLSLLDCRDIRLSLPRIDREGAAIKLSPDERFLYTSCRWDSTIDVFSLTDGLPTHLGTIDTVVRQPRDFLITNDGLWLLTAGQRSGDVCVFRRDPDSGFAEKVFSFGGLEKPVCLLEV